MSTEELEREIAELKVRNVVLASQLADEKAKINRFLSYLKKLHENDMDFVCTTTLEECLRDGMLDIFKEAHKMEGSI